MVYDYIIYEEFFSKIMLFCNFINLVCFDLSHISKIVQITQ